MKPTAQIFLCYAKEDKPQVEGLYQKLKEAGFEPWMDKVDLIGGEKWQPTIQNAIKKAHFFVACVSRHWVPTNPQERKRFFRREIQTALDVLPELPPGDIFIIPIRLEECEVPESLSLFHWIDYFQPDGWERLLKAIHSQLKKLGLMRPLRSHPATLSRAQVSLMLREFDFFDSDMNPAARGIKHEYERRGTIVWDGATSLMWQQGGLSSVDLRHANSGIYISNLNTQKFAGFSDWRLPTLEEAMSLVEPEENSKGLHIDPVFDNTQSFILTADKDVYDADIDADDGDIDASYREWMVNFARGNCFFFGAYGEDYYFIRAVRS